MRLRWILAAALAATLAFVAVVLRERDPKRAEYCVAEVDGTRVELDLEQTRWASLMAAQAQNRGLPPRATTIAIATAFQESKIRNIDYGDRDSLGLFQQRPSQGWGTEEQVMDPFHAINRFYDGLVKIDNYEGLEITVAAQAVQRSGFPEAYAQHEPASRALASSLRGFSPAAFTCQMDERGGGSSETVVADVEGAFGALGSTIAADTVTTMFGGDPVDMAARSWALAHYAVANAQRLGITTVSLDGRRWTIENSPDGWVEDPAAPPGTVVISTR